MDPVPIENVGAARRSQTASDSPVQAPLAIRTADIGGVPHVAVDALAQGSDGAALLADLEALGLIGGAAYDNVVSGLLPAPAVGDLEGLASLRSIIAAISRPARPCWFSGRQVALASPRSRLARCSVRA